MYIGSNHHTHTLGKALPQVKVVQEVHYCNKFMSFSVTLRYGVRRFIPAYVHALGVSLSYDVDRFIPSHSHVLRLCWDKPWCKIFVDQTIITIIFITSYFKFFTLKYNIALYIVSFSKLDKRF